MKAKPKSLQFFQRSRRLVRRIAELKTIIKHGEATSIGDERAQLHRLQDRQRELDNDGFGLEYQNLAN